MVNSCLIWILKIFLIIGVEEDIMVNFFVNEYLIDIFFLVMIL